MLKTLFPFPHWAPWTSAARRVSSRQETENISQSKMKERNLPLDNPKIPRKQPSRVTIDRNQNEQDISDVHSFQSTFYPINLTIPNAKHRNQDSSTENKSTLEEIDFEGRH